MKRPATNPVSQEPTCVYRRRAHRLAMKGELRKAALALRELVSIEGSAASWVMLGAMLQRAGRRDDALDALRQGLYLHKQQGATKRARTVARLILALDPGDHKSARLAA